jgi:peptidoglycan hydrolase CwlO-like protein
MSFLRKKPEPTFENRLNAFILDSNNKINSNYLPKESALLKKKDILERQLVVEENKLSNLEENMANLKKQIKEQVKDVDNILDNLTKQEELITQLSISKERDKQKKRDMFSSQILGMKLNPIRNKTNHTSSATRSAKRSPPATRSATRSIPKPRGIRRVVSSIKTSSDPINQSGNIPV